VVVLGARADGMAGRNVHAAKPFHEVQFGQFKVDRGDSCLGDWIPLSGRTTELTTRAPMSLGSGSTAGVITDNVENTR
jgi:hypothetical protein